jgi:hypothetical protein
MNIQLVETIKQHKYGGRKRTVGQRYEAARAHLPILIKARWVKIIEPKPVPALVPASGPEPRPPMKPTRNYKRRDLTAEK